MNEYVLMTYYVKYLKEIRKVSDSTVKHYQEALRYISKYLVQKKKLKQTVYEIQDIGELEIIKAYLYSDSYFVALDKRGHQMYSAGFNNYFKFANGEGFANIHQQIGILDTEVPVAEKHTKIQTFWERSSIIKIQSIESAGYQCEINLEHQTFTARSTGHPYMEGHHVLPMKYQDMFDKSLDVYANIVCLCPLCHRLLHYGVDTEKENVLTKIYYDRSDRLAASGIKISKSDFERLVV
jgi:5-methylcytosine-specific restriction protein A